MPQRNLCGRQHWSGHCLFRESQGVSQTFFHASFFSFTPSPFFRGPFFPLLCCSSQWPLLRGQRQTLRPAKGLSASMVSFALEQKRTDAAHTQQPPPQTSPQQTPTFSLNSLFLRYLLSPLPFNDKAFTSKDHPLFCTVGTFLIFITSNDYCCLSCASELNEKKQQRTCPRKLKAKYSCTTYFILKDILNNDFVVTHWPVNWM